MKHVSVWADGKCPCGELGTSLVALECLTHPGSSNERCAVVAVRTEDGAVPEWRVVGCAYFNKLNMTRPVFDMRFGEFLAAIGFDKPVCLLSDGKYGNITNDVQDYVKLARFEKEISEVFAHSNFKLEVSRRLALARN